MIYTTKEKIETYLGKTISVSLVDYISAAEQYINQITGRNFTADASATSRVYNGTNTQELFIDDCIEITKVEVGNDYYGDTKVETTDFIKMPANHTALEVPINKIWSKSKIFSSGLQNHRITAKWGYSVNVPDDIKWVATFLASSIYKSGINGNIAGIKSQRIGEYSVTFTNDKELTDFNKVNTILNSYKRYRV